MAIFNSYVCLPQGNPPWISIAKSPGFRGNFRRHFADTRRHCCGRRREALATCGWAEFVAAIFRWIDGCLIGGLEHFWWVNPLFLWPFSISMVIIYTYIYILIAGLEHEFYCSIHWEYIYSNWLFFSDGLKPPNSSSLVGIWIWSISIQECRWIITSDDWWLITSMGITIFWVGVSTMKNIRI